jgi:hypothetical protein
MAVYISEKDRGLNRRKNNLFVNTFELSWTAGRFR